MKKRLIQLSVITLIGIAMGFYGCSKDEEDPLSGDANLTGTIIDSQTGLGLANATLYFTRDLSATDYDNADYIISTDANGNFTLTNAVSGNYICFVVSNGFFERIITGISLASGDNTMDPITLVNAPSEGSFRIVLTWGETPYDLDSHLTGPDGSGGRFHMYYSNPDPNQYINLDVDDTESYGPETTTISGFFDGTYRFSVNNYTNGQEATGGLGIAQSPAKVEVYTSTGLSNTYNAPAFTGNGDTWRVFEIVISGNNANINSINTYVLSSSDEDTNVFKESDKKNTQFDLANF